MAENPYKLLGLKKSASEAEIRKAYRSLAKKLHPDVNPDPKAAERFKNISAAYSLLTDKDMKARYDSGQVDASGQQQNPFAGRRGPNGQAGGFAGGGFDDMGDIFSSLFGMQGGRQGGMRGQQRRSRPQKGQDVRFAMSVDFLDAVNGVSKTVRMGNGKTLKLTIPTGTDDGSVLRLRGKGEAGIYGGPSGDAKVDITVTPHKYFKREGKHLRLDLPITLKEAALGGKVKVPTPSGSVTVSVPAGASSGKTLRLKGKGVKGGDMLVRLMIVLPEGGEKALGKFISKNKTLFDDDPRADMLP
ncbi:MAG: DnaJ C-terminal domain-containing protein [Robiginitomaculum sp.]